MALSRKLLLLTVLLLMAQPLMACIECQFDGNCAWVPPPNLRCKVTIDGCTDGALCGGFAPEALASQWTVASVEVTRPAEPAMKVEKAKTEVAVNVQTNHSEKTQ